jgi:hypothetical protein
MNKEKLRRFLYEYFNDTISDDDRIELLNYLKKTNPDKISEIINEDMLSLHEGPDMEPSVKELLFQRITADARFSATGSDSQQPQARVHKFNPKFWLTIAAVILIACIVIAPHYLNSKKNGPLCYTAKHGAVSPIVPGGKKAILTLADGSVVVLDTAKAGQIGNATNAFKSHKGQLVYVNPATANADQKPEAAIAYNTLSTPKGGEFQVVLPDGTKVWLNSASSLRYPIAFTGKTRYVELSGEAYFEVAKNKEQPFIVHMNKAEIKVLGTHFNISAYSDDAQITTTLLEGSVQVRNDKSTSLIKPGQQAIVDKADDRIDIGPANIEKVMAWKNGYFVFDDQSLTSIMNQVSRWYDVEIEYRGNFNNIRIGGTFYRSKSISELLADLEKIGKIHFKISGRRIVIME